jgi:hypothetical protein
MRVPNWERFVHWSQGFALLICGMIIGAAVFMSITHHHLEAEITKSNALQSEIDDLLEDNEDLNMYKNKQTVIKSVRVGVDNPPGEKSLDDVIVNEIVQRVEDDLKKLKGQPISNIEQDPHQIRDIYGARLLPGIHGKDYLVEIHTLLVIYGELKIWISAKEYIRQPS